MKQNSRILTFRSVDSTNSYLLRNPGLLDENFFAVRAIEQTGGRGRYGRNWFSEPGKDLTVSLVFHPQTPLEGVSVATLFAGLAAFNTLKKILPEKLYLRWPNDIYYEDKKICGILCELALRDREKPAVIIGIGINVNSSSFGHDIEPRATSLLNATGTEYNIEEIFSDLLDNLQSILLRFSLPVQESILNEWISHCRLDEEVLYDRSGTYVRGYIQSIKGDGSLIIKDVETTSLIRYSGDVLYDS